MINTPSRADLERLEAQFRKTRAEDRSLWGLVESIHSNPALREFVTVESRPLCPGVELPVEGREAVIHLLLALPDGEGGFLPPWAHIAWNWPSRRLRGFGEIEASTDRPAAGLTIQHRCTREFSDAVERALAENTSPPGPPEPIPEWIRRASGREVVAGVPEVAPEQVAGEPRVWPQTERFSDLLPRLEEAHRFLRELSSPEIEREWRRIQSRLSSTRFTVAVVGERSRGKSSLINRLLGEDLLPIGRGERNAAFIEVTATDEPLLEVTTPGGERRRVLLDKDHLKTAAREPGNMLRAGLANPWLVASGIRFVELPSADALGDQGIEQILDILVTADAVLVTVSATMALAMDEKAFVEQHVLARRAPRVAIVLTHLDSVREEERGEVLEFVRQKIAPWGSGISIWVPLDVVLPAGGADGVVAGVEAIRRVLVQWAESGERGALARLQVIAGARHLLNLARAHLLIRLEVAGLAEDERRRKLAEAQRHLDSQQLDWEDLRLEMERRQAQACQLLVDEMQSRRHRILDELQYELSRCPLPKQWWERDLPVQLRRRLEETERALGRSLDEGLRQDARWLMNEVARRFSRNLLTSGTAPLVQLEHEFDRTAADDLRDLQHLRLLIRGGSVAAASASYFLFQAGAMLSGSLILAGEALLLRMTSTQRGQLNSLLPGALDQILARGTALARQRVEAAYQDIVKTVRREQEAALRVERQALEQPMAHNERQEVGRRIAELDRLAQHLTVLEKGGDSHDRR